jgi:hypothetical protein
MLTGELRSQIDRIWMAFFTGGIAMIEHVALQLSEVGLFSNINVTFSL